MVDKNAHYLMCKGGVYYFTRHVPNDLKEQYNTPRIVICLKTRNKNSALKASRSMAGKLDDFWLQLRVANIDIPAIEFIIFQSQYQVLNGLYRAFWKFKNTGLRY